MVDYLGRAFRIAGPFAVIMVGCLATVILALVATIFGAL